MKKKGFTLVEILVVISIIGLLAGLIFTTYGPAQKQGRDSQRKSDFNQYHIALESFANVNSDSFPSYTSTVAASGSLCTSLGSTISGCPDDPRKTDDASYVYNYQSNGTGGGSVNASHYVLWGKLESSGDYWVICSNGKNGKKAQSGFAVSGGTCPI